MRFHNAFVTFEPQNPVVEQFGAENIPFVRGRLVHIIVLQELNELYEHMINALCFNIKI